MDNRKRFNAGVSAGANGASSSSSAAPSKKPRRSDDDDDGDFNDDLDMEDDMARELEEEEMDEEAEEEAASGGAEGEVSELMSASGIPLARQTKWNRDPLESPINPATDSITFQQMEIDYYVADKPRPGMPGVTTGRCSVLRLYGVTAKGHSVLAHVHGFTSHFYIQAPAGFTSADCEGLKSALNVRLRAQSSTKILADEEAVVQVVIVEKQSIMNYRFNQTGRFLKIYTSLPKYVPTCRTILEAGFTFGRFPAGIGATTYETNILFVLRFMIDTDVLGANWIEFPATKYTVRSEGKDVPSENQKASFCQIEIDASFEDMISHPAEGEYMKIAPLRILSFDIECSGRKGVFPEAEHDPVIQIANMVTVQGHSKPIIKNVFTLNTCANIVGADVYSFAKEEDLLAAWSNFLRKSDADLITGYNIMNFDIPYLINRAEKLKVKNFAYLGRLKGVKSRLRETKFSSKAYGTRESHEITLDGRVPLDVLQAVQRDHKLSSYSLNSVSAHFLGEQKEDVHHSIIGDLQNGNDETRRRLAVYCLKDAYLPQRLLDKLMIVINYIEMARVTGVPLSFLLARGQQIKVVSQLLRKSKEKHLVMPATKVSGTSDVMYEGATVLEPKKGFYEQPVATLDFASLYPSIMMAHNLCYSTLIRNADLTSGKIAPEDITRTPSGDHFVSSRLYKGILPQILEDLIGARKRAKEDLKREKDPLKKAVLDGRQLALKISANSVYGFTGATVGKLPCLEISKSVTAFGRQMIDATKLKVEQHYTVANGYSANATVIYGDTDSVMVDFGVKSLKEAMDLGKQAAAEVTKQFIQPIKLEFEKVYFPYLLISKKRYAGLLYTNPEKYDKLDTKGLETVRRDNCQLVRTVITTVLDKLLIHRSPDGAVKYVKDAISDLLMNKMDISMLVITKSLSKDESQYAAKQAHVELAERMRKRDPGTAPNIGDRVPFVIVKAAKGAKAYEKSEDPIYALENNIPIDVQYYLEHQLSLPLTRIFEPILKDPKILFTGDHTRSISVPTPTVGGLMKFTKVQLTCLSCKAALTAGEKSVCKACKPRESDIYQKHLGIVNNLETLHGRTWAQCQRCQGSLHQDVLCSSRDCPIFYMRRKVQKDLKDAFNTLQRFDSEDLDW